MCINGGVDKFWAYSAVRMAISWVVAGLTWVGWASPNPYMRMGRSGIKALAKFVAALLDEASSLDIILWVGWLLGCMVV